MTRVHVLLPEGVNADIAGAVRYWPAELSARLVEFPGPLALVSDSVDGAAADAVALAVRQHGSPVVEVRLAHWDGEEHSPIGAACRGVIAGFGARGVREAVRFLEQL